MRVPYYTVDVFSEERFGGNPLAVLPDATGLTSALMANIAREFNYAETTFVLPAIEPQHTRRVRIFTPGGEIPFAGHPNLGTAFVLAARGDIRPVGSSAQVIFEEDAGPVPVTIRFAGQRPHYCELTAPQAFSRGPEYPAETVAAAIGLEAQDIVCRVHAPTVASVGLPFLLVEVRDLQVLGRACVHHDKFAALEASDAFIGVHLYTRDVGDLDVDVRARMYAPLIGVPEDPATGSANCALAGLLAHRSDKVDGTLTWRIAQGIEMGRSSSLQATVRKRRGDVTTVQVGGACVSVAEGWMQVR
jgi:trans-2,3-dihydro-3-hydroxyanthranilate isomerase